MRQWIPPGEQAATVDDAVARLVPPSMVLATMSPVVALAYPDRRLLVAWGTEIPTAVTASGLAVLLPNRTLGSEEAARAAFPGVRGWRTHDIGAGARLLVAAAPDR
jgi:hypothetical protein